MKNVVESDEFDFSDLLDKELKENSKGITKGVTKLKWYPKGLAYQLNLSRQEIKASEKLLKLQGFLTSESENGYITRQVNEIISFKLSLKNLFSSLNRRLFRLFLLLY